MLVAVIGAGFSSHWSRFHSTIYPYTISLPSTFRHQTGQTSAGDPVDYFFPGQLGSFTTNVNIVATRGADPVNEMAYLRARGGHHVRISGRIRLMHRWVSITRADFAGLTGPWTEQQVAFAAGGYIWRVTASYIPRYRKLWPTMRKMIGTFHLR